MKDIKDKISIIMPAYNESECIVSSIQEVAKTFQDFGCLWELIIMDDGSTDDTYIKASGCLECYPPGQLIVKRNSVNQGKGRAVKKAMHYISGAYVVFLDADMDLHPLQVQTLFDIMRLDNADVVIGSKLHPNSVVNYPLQRRVMSFVYYLLVRALFSLPCHDTQTGLKLFKADVLRQVFGRLLVKKFAFDLELLVNLHHLGFKIAEAPIVLDNRRPYGRIGLKATFTTMWDTLAVFYRLRVLRYYDHIDYYRHKNASRTFKRPRRN